MRLLPELRDAGQVIGPLLPAVAEETGLSEATPVIAVGSHDTASAVVGVPAGEGDRFAYISCGTWSLVGLELEQPVLSAASRSRELHQRGRGGRPDPLPAQRHGPLAAAGMPADVGQ